MHRTTTDLKEMIRAGKGDIPADLIIKNGNLINVSSEEIYQANVAVYKDKIVAIGDVEGYEGPETDILDVTESGKRFASSFRKKMKTFWEQCSFTALAKRVVSLSRWPLSYFPRFLSCEVK